MSVNLLTDFQGNQLPLANDNLLINGDFRNPVNQRGQSSYTADATYHKVYSVDRWAVTYRGKVTVNDGYITVENTNTNPSSTQVEAYFVQQFENILNADLVLQVKVKSVAGDVKVFGNALKTGLNVFASDSSIARGNITFVIGYGASIELEYIKLEQGSVATPFIPRLYAEELALCERYTLKIPNSYNAYTGSGGKIYIVYQKLMNMRTNPNVIALPSSTNIVINNGTVNFDIESILCNKETGEITVNVNNPTSTLFSKTIGGWFSNSVILDAEIK